MPGVNDLCSITLATQVQDTGDADISIHEVSKKKNVTGNLMLKKEKCIYLLIILIINLLRILLILFCL